MRRWVQFLASLSGLRIQHCFNVGHRCGLDPELLWLWCRPAATAPIQPLAWEPPYAKAVALKRQKEKISAFTVQFSSCTNKPNFQCLTPTGDWWLQSVSLCCLGPDPPSSFLVTQTSPDPPQGGLPSSLHPWLQEPPRTHIQAWLPNPCYLVLLTSEHIRKST